MKMNERQLSRLSRSVVAEQKLIDLIVEDSASSKFEKILNTPKGQELERKAQRKATTLLQKSEGSMRTVGDLKRAIGAALSKRADKREKGTFWASIGGTIGSLLYPLLSIVGQSVKDPKTSALGWLAGPYGMVASIVGGGLVSMLTNIMLQRNAVRGTALADFAVNPRILNAVPDHIEGEFVQYMASVLQNAPDNTPLDDFDMTRELLYFMKDKYGLEIKDLTQKNEGFDARGSSAGTAKLVERRVRRIKKSLRERKFTRKQKALQKKALAHLAKPKNKAALAFWYLENYMSKKSGDEKFDVAQRIMNAQEAIQALYKTGRLPKLEPEIKGVVDNALESVDIIFKPLIEKDNEIQDFIDVLERGQDLIKKTRFR